MARSPGLVHVRVKIKIKTCFYVFHLFYFPTESPLNWHKPSLWFFDDPWNSPVQFSSWKNSSDKIRNHLSWSKIGKRNGLGERWNRVEKRCNSVHYLSFFVLSLNLSHPCICFWFIKSFWSLSTSGSHEDVFLIQFLFFPLSCVQDFRHKPGKTSIGWKPWRCADTCCVVQEVQCDCRI